MTDINEQLILIAGKSASGKSASLRGLTTWLEPKSIMYLNTEAGKRLPFANKFNTYKITDPQQVYEGFDFARGHADTRAVVVDSITFLMEMYETMYVKTATNTMVAWGSYGDYFRNLMQDKVTSLGKPVIFTAHTRDDYDEVSMSWRSQVPIKGALKGTGIEAYFSTVVAAKSVPITQLENYSSPLLNITEEEATLGFKYVFQTRLTKETTGERIRSPMGMFTPAETFMDNDAGLLLQRLNEYYA